MDGLPGSQFRGSIHSVDAAAASRRRANDRAKIVEPAGGPAAASHARACRVKSVGPNPPKKSNAVWAAVLRLDRGRILLFRDR